MELTTSASKSPNATGDSADAAFEHAGEELASQLAELEAKELAQVERALLRIKQGTYGVCEACATKIPVARLNALPYSTLCIKCQREAETDTGSLGEPAARTGTRSATRTARRRPRRRPVRPGDRPEQVTAIRRDTQGPQA